MTEKESQSVEFKRDWGDDNLKVISAFANNKGGVLYIGIDDLGKTHALKDVKKLLEDIPNTIRNKLGIIPMVELFTENNTDLVKISIESSSEPISFKGNYYIRSGSTVQALQGRELAEFLLKKIGVTWDGANEDRACLDLDISTIEKFKRYSVDRIPSMES